MVMADDLAYFFEGAEGGEHPVAHQAVRIRIGHILFEQGVLLLYREGSDIVQGRGDYQMEELILLELEFFANIVGGNGNAPVMRLEQIVEAVYRLDHRYGHFCQSKVIHGSVRVPLSVWKLLLK